MFVAFIFFGILTVFGVHDLKNTNYVDVEELLDQFEVTFYAAILFSSGIIYFFLILLKKKFPKLFYLETNKSGIIIKGVFFQEKKISWEKIEKFYIINYFDAEFVTIKFKSNYKPARWEKNVLIPGNPKKVLKILNESLSISRKTYSK
tara:strand:- start:1644 stop:2087 length:444 start_codon:yes stop_codon:yes gene_type:complete